MKDLVREAPGKQRGNRLEKLNDVAVEKIECAMGELEYDFVKGEKVATGLVDTGRLRQIIQSMKDLRELTAPVVGQSEGASRLYAALEQEEV